MSNMRLALRDNITDELLAIIFDKLPEGMLDDEIEDMIQNAPGLDGEIEEMLQNEKFYLSYEREDNEWIN